MKSKEDSLQPLFDALRQDAEPVDPERQARAVERFHRSRLGQKVEGLKKPGFFGFVSKDDDARSEPRPDEPKPPLKPRTPRSETKREID